MSEEPIAFVSVLRLSRNDMKILRIKDAYGLHRVVYGLFEKMREDNSDEKNNRSGILWADKGSDYHERRVLIISDRKPHQTPQFGSIETRGISERFIGYEDYLFEVTVNPVRRPNGAGKAAPVLGNQAIAEWVIERAATQWGFRIDRQTLEVKTNQLQRFTKKDNQIIHHSATLKGHLTVVDTQKFRNSFLYGVGRGKAFGFGLLQVVPTKKNSEEK